MASLRTATLFATLIGGAVTATPVHASGPALTVAAYRTKANLVCANEQHETSVTVGQTTKLAQYLTAELPVIRYTLASLKRLEPPATLASLHSQVVATVSGELTLFVSLAAQAKAGELTFAQFEANRQLKQLDKRELDLWKRIGAGVCAFP